MSREWLCLSGRDGEAAGRGRLGRLLGEAGCGGCWEGQAVEAAGRAEGGVAFYYFVWQLSICNNLLNYALCIMVYALCFFLHVYSIS